MKSPADDTGTRPRDKDEMKHQPSSGAVVFAKDLSRVAAFYEALLPMVVVHAEADHVVLESSACQLVIHAVPKRIAASIQLADPPKRRSQTPIKLFFYVGSLADVRAKAPGLGGALDPASGEWAARDFRACDGHDPEGNVVQFRERAGGAATAA